MSRLPVTALGKIFSIEVARPDGSVLPDRMTVGQHGVQLIEELSRGSERRFRVVCDNGRFVEEFAEQKVLYVAAAPP